MLHAAVVLAWLPAACGNFFSSLQSNFVVNLDFGAERLGPDGTDVAKYPGSLAETKLMTFAGGRRKFRCRLPSGRSTGSADLDKVKANFRAAKTLALRGRCVTLHKPDDYWTYDVCFGRKVVQYRPTTDMRFSLGEHVPELDELNNDGSVRELYTGGSENRSTQILFACGIYAQESVRLSESTELSYAVRVLHPAFCPWRDLEGAETATQDQVSRRIKASALLEDLRSRCVNLTQGWWTFEYCFPHTMQQVHVNNGERETTHILGTINGSSEPTGPGEVNMKLVRLKPTIHASERRAPPSSHRTLQQWLGMGAVCDETGRARAAVINFQCPPNWQSRPETRIISVTEPTLCEYEVMVHTVLLCGHQRFVPALPKGKEEITCLAEELS